MWFNRLLCRFLKHVRPAVASQRGIVFELYLCRRCNGMEFYNYHNHTWYQEFPGWPEEMS
jgi:hypothetical protein